MYLTNIFFMSNIVCLIIIHNLYNYVGSKTNKNREKYLKKLFKNAFKKKHTLFSCKKHTPYFQFIIIKTKKF